MKDAFIGIDVAFAKQKRLPVAVCTWSGERLVPARLRDLPFEPPRGHGNVATLDAAGVRQFALDAVDYVVRVCQRLGVNPARIALDAPSSPRAEGVRRRAAEAAMDEAGISCFTTPTASEFGIIHEKVRDHIEAGGAENRLPHANQLWMTVGFELFRRLGEIAPCLEVFPQATARVLGVAQVHKTVSGGVEAQLAEAARHTGWPSEDPSEPGLAEIAFGPSHDCLDAYLSAWVAALPERNRIAFGNPPNDVIWTPRVGNDVFQRPTVRRRPRPRQQPRPEPVGAPGELERLCPCCESYMFRRWPFGWDAHAAHRCPGLSSTGTVERKREFKSRFGHLFKCVAPRARSD